MYKIFKRFLNIISNYLNSVFLYFGFKTLIIRLDDYTKKIKSLDNKNISKYLKNLKYYRFLEGSIIEKDFQEILVSWIECDSNFFKKIEKYYLTREEQLKKKNLDDIKIDFIDKAIFTGAFGMPYHFQVYMEANELSFNESKPVTLISNELFSYKKKYSITNNFLFSYFKKFLKVISENKDINIFLLLSEELNLPIKLIIPIKKKFLQIEIAKNIVTTEQNRRKIFKPFLTLSNEHNLSAKKSLSKLGINIEKDWFVTLHVRETGWHENNNSEFFRNANINDYNLAVEYILNKGGKVVRVGNDKMVKLVEKPGIIDYAHYTNKSEELDIFLGAKSRFCLATSSGFFRVPGYFNVPVILTNSTNTIVYFGLKNKDIFLPTLLKNKETNQFISLKNIMFPPYSMVAYDVEKKYQKWNLEIVKNSPEDILIATEEMINRLNSNNFFDLTTLQKKMKDLININQNIYTTETINAHALFPDKFLIKHRDLL